MDNQTLANREISLLASLTNVRSNGEDANRTSAGCRQRSSLARSVWRGSMKGIGLRHTIMTVGIVQPDDAEGRALHSARFAKAGEAESRIAEDRIKG